MNFKQLYREYRLSKLTGGLNPEAKEVIDFLEENLTGLNTYVSNKWSEYFFYGKDKDNIVLEYNTKNGYLYIHYNKIWSFFSSRKSYNHSDTQDIISWWVGSTLKLKPSNTAPDLILTRLYVGSTLKLKPSNTPSLLGVKTFTVGVTLKLKPK